MMLRSLVVCGLQRGIGRGLAAPKGMATSASKKKKNKMPEVMKPERLVLPEDYKWKVLAATAIERLPPYPPILPDWERDFEAVRDYVESKNNPRFASDEDVEVAFAKLKGQEVKKIKAVKKPKPRMQEEEEGEEGLPQGMTAEFDFNTESPLEEFVVPEIDYDEERDDDPKNRRSLERAKRNRLFLLIQKTRLSGNGYDDLYKGEVQFPWEFPGITAWETGETIRATAERGMREECGNMLKVYYYSNMPSNMIQIRYNDKKAEETGLLGERLFIMNAMYCDGQLRLRKSDVRSFAWLKRSELRDYLVTRWRRVADESLLD